MKTKSKFYLNETTKVRKIKPKKEEVLGTNESGKTAVVNLITLAIKLLLILFFLGKASGIVSDIISNMSSLRIGNNESDSLVTENGPSTEQSVEEQDTVTEIEHTDSKVIKATSLTQMEPMDSSFIWNQSSTSTRQVTYSRALSTCEEHAYSIYNLNNRYTKLSGVLCMEEGSPIDLTGSARFYAVDSNRNEYDLPIICDGETTYELTVDGYSTAKELTVDLTDVDLLKVELSGYVHPLMMGPDAWVILAEPTLSYS